MSRCGIGFAAVVLGAVLFAGTCLAQDDGVAASARHGRLFLEGVSAYQEGDHATAAARFEDLADSGVHNGKLYYNLGNAYLKAGDLGRAVLWYERAALLLGPVDPELRFNLAYARNLVVDQTPEVGVDWGRVLLFWRGRTPRSVLVAGAVAANAALWLLLAGYRLWRRRGLRRWAIVCAGLLSVLVLTLGYDAWDARHAGGGVILPAEVAVRAATSPDATELFRLHAGSLVRVDRQQGGYLRIRFGQDALGWVPQEQIGLIRDVHWAPDS